jgi:hypothetical protein
MHTAARLLTNRFPPNRPTKSQININVNTPNKAGKSESKIPYFQPKKSTLKSKKSMAAQIGNPRLNDPPDPGEETHPAEVQSPDEPLLPAGQICQNKEKEEGG